MKTKSKPKKEKSADFMRLAFTPIREYDPVRICTHGKVFYLYPPDKSKVR
jgi:hypothetical protein